jgi:hypothetical protein
MIGKRRLNRRAAKKYLTTEDITEKRKRGFNHEGTKKHLTTEGTGDTEERRKGLYHKGTKTQRKTSEYFFLFVLPLCLGGEKKSFGHGAPCPYAYERMLLFV